jgi:hypothetical protein
MMSEGNEGRRKEGMKEGRKEGENRKPNNPITLTDGLLCFGRMVDAFAYIFDINT